MQQMQNRKAGMSRNSKAKAIMKILSKNHGLKFISTSRLPVFPWQGEGLAEMMRALCVPALIDRERITAVPGEIMEGNAAQC